MKLVSPRSEAVAQPLAPAGARRASTAFQIRIAGELDPEWAAWFEGCTVTADDGDTLITSPTADQAALHGLLKKVRDLGMPLVSVGRLDAAPSAAARRQSRHQKEDRS